MTDQEKYFCEGISKVKSTELEPRSLLFHYLDEETTFTEAHFLANSALEWAEELEADFQKFGKRATSITKSSEEKFLNYCKKNNWSVKRTSNGLIARDKMKFKAKFELHSKEVFMDPLATGTLDLMKIINSLEDE